MIADIWATSHYAQSVSPTAPRPPDPRGLLDESSPSVPSADHAALEHVRLQARRADLLHDLLAHTRDDDLQRQRHRVRSARTMHSGLIGSVHTLSPWTPPGLNDCAVSARPEQTWPQVAHHPQRKGPSVPDQRKRRRRMVAIRSSDGATAGSGPSQLRAFSSLPW